MKPPRNMAAAIAIGCAAGCVPPPPAARHIDPQLAQSQSAARLALEQGAIEESISLYRLALARAELADDPASIGPCAYNLGIVLGRDKQFEQARAALHEAEREFARAGNAAAGVMLAEARIAQLQGRPADAAALAQSGLAHGPSPSEKVQLHVVKAEAALTQKDAAAARVELNAADASAQGPVSSGARAGLEALRGKIDWAEGDPLKAAVRFDTEAGLRRHDGDYRDMAHAMGRAGEAYLAGQQPALAADRLYRAARSLLAQRDQREAKRLAELAIQAANQATDQPLADDVKSLMARMNPPSAATEPAP